jgi:SAM-dependent methyltransferase
MRLNIIANCTERKTVAPEARLSRVEPRSDGAKRADSWWNLLGHEHWKRTKAVSLYAGDHWFVVKSMQDIAGSETRLWAISAGYGLISADQEICSYSATFAPGHPDSVGDDATAAADWWTRLAGKKIPGHDQPRSLSELFERDPSDVFLVIVSPKYLGAVEDDLQTAFQVLKPSGRLVVVSSGGAPRNRLGEVFVAADGRLQKELGGTRASLVARTARQLLNSVDQHHFEIDAIRRSLKKFSTDVPEFRMPVRERSVDSEVVEFIKAALRKDHAASYTKLLHMYRHEGRACEMRRFKGLYSEAKKGN